MDGFAGPGRGGADGFFRFGGAPEVGDYADAAGVHVHHGGVFVCVGHVLGDVFEH